MSAEVRPAAAEDIPALLPLVEQYWLFEDLSGFDAGPVARELRCLCGDPRLGSAWIARVRGEAVGYLLALVTYIQGVPVTFGEGDQARTVLIHPSHNVGVIFTFTFLLVILITHSTVRGTASLTVILALIAITLFFAYMGWWDDILRAIGDLAMFMNLGFYLFFSTALFILWAAAVFAFDRLHYYTFRPGQMVSGAFIGGGEQTWDTRGMSVEKKKSLEVVRQLAEQRVLVPVVDRRYQLETIADAHRYVDTGRKRGNVVVAVREA